MKTSYKPDCRCQWDRYCCSLCFSSQFSHPQTIEHLQILQFLGVQSGFVAITHADQADEEMIEFVSEDIATTTKGTFLEGAPIFTFHNLHSYMERDKKDI